MSIVHSDDDVVAVETVPYLQWGPVVAGAMGAAAISFVLYSFGTALGLSAISPHPFRGMSGTSFLVIGALYACVVQVVSYAAGGYLAGRMRSPRLVGDEGERHFRDGAHGFAVWALGLLLTAAVVASGAGGVLKTTTEAAAVVSAGAAGGATANASNRLGLEPTDYATDLLFRPAPNANPAAPPATTEDRAPVTRVFTASLRNGSLSAADRTYLGQVVARQTGLPQAEAEKRVDEAYAEAKRLEQRARDIADKARKTAIVAAFLTAATLAIALAAACAAAALGANDRDRRTARYWMGSVRFW